jgi:hypothetical protein
MGAVEAPMGPVGIVVFTPCSPGAFVLWDTLFAA